MTFSLALLACLWLDDAERRESQAADVNVMKWLSLCLLVLGSRQKQLPDEADDDGYFDNPTATAARQAAGRYLDCPVIAV